MGRRFVGTCGLAGLAQAGEGLGGGGKAAGSGTKEGGAARKDETSGERHNEDSWGMTVGGSLCMQNGLRIGASAGRG